MNDFRVNPNLNRIKSPAFAGGFRLPFITLIIILISVPLSLSLPLFELSYFDQQLIQQGQLWRLVSGHLSHTSLSHLQWDLLAFALAAGYLELHSRKLLLAALLTALVLLDTHLMSPSTSISRYAGLSGMLFAPLTISLVIFARKQPSINGWIPLIICLGKLIWEQFSQHALLSQSTWPTYPAAHIVGSLAGLLVILMIWIHSQIKSNSSMHINSK